MKALLRFFSRMSCLALACLFLLAACAPASGGGGNGAQQPTPSASATKPPAPAAATPTISASVKPSTSPPNASLDACSLLTREEVAAAVGGSVKEGAPDIANSCKWEKGDPASISVSLHLLSLPPQAKCAAGRQGSSPVTGLGVEASWQFTEPAETGSVVACPQGWQVQVTLVGDLVNHTTKEDTLRAAGEALMGKALKRM